MRIALIDVDGHNFPNLPLMKLSAWHKKNGDQVEWYDPLTAWLNPPDRVYMLKDIFFDDEEEVYQIHPKKSEYVNLSENCLHLWKPIGHELGELVEKRYE